MRSSGRSLRASPGQGNAVHPVGHHNVGEQDIDRSILLQDREGFRRIRRGQDLIAEQTQGFGGYGENIVVVLRE